MTHKLPLFPLNTVLFPGMPISLYIFEERYRLMIGRCLDQNAPFGVVLIRDGSEVDSDAIPHLVGTTAQITESVQMEDGRYYLAATGQRRFRIQYIAQRQPYIVGSISYLPEESGTAVVEPANQLRALYTRYWRALASATGYRHDLEALPDDVIGLTYWMAHRLQIGNAHKQRWLEADLATRLREMTAAINAELLLLPETGSNKRESDWKGPGSWN